MEQANESGGRLPTRRRVTAGLAAGLAAAGLSPRMAMAAGRPAVGVAATSPRYLCNAVAQTRGGATFLGLPRWQLMDDTPSVAKVEADGTLSPFPGGGWNRPGPDADPRTVFNMVNTLHIFADDTLWVVDQGLGSDRATSLPGGQKLLQFDTSSGRLLQALHFGPDILPPGAQMNDLRLSGHLIYVTDSGLGGIIVHDLATGGTIRRLSGHPLLKATPGLPLRAHGGQPFQDAAGKQPVVNSDALEVSADGRWLYFSTPTGPLRRLSTAAIRDGGLGDAQLAAQVQTVGPIPTIGGTAIDTLGNIYLSDGEHRRITVLTPAGKRLTLVEDERLVTPDALFITADRRMLVPCPQGERLPMFNRGTNGLRLPFLVLSFPLPERLDGQRLGDAVTG